MVYKYIQLLYNIDKDGIRMHAVFYPSKDKSDYSIYIRKSISIKNKKSKITIEKYPSIKELGLSLDDAKKFADKRIKELESEEASRISQNTSLEIDFNRKIKEGNRLKNTGILFLQKVWSELKLEQFFNKLKFNEKLKINYSLNDTTRFLSYSRIIKPGSKLSTFQQNNDYIESFAITLNSIYDTLTFLDKYQTKITKYCNKNCAEFLNKESESIFYDCTNFYFEIENSDDDNFRSYGVEKNHRPDPIVEYGLLFSEDGFPISSHVSNGNKGEKETLLPLLKGCDEEFTKGKIIVGDAGLNTTNNKKVLHETGRNYIYVQSIKQLSDKNEFKDAEIKNGKDTHRTISIQQWCLDKSDMNSYDSEKGKMLYKERWIKRTNDLEERLIVKFDENLEKFLLNKIDKRLKRAKEIINNPSKLTFNNCTDGKEFIKKIEIDKKTGEINKSKSILEIDETRVEKEKKFAGFYAFVTDIPGQNDLSQEEINKHKKHGINVNPKSAIEILKIAGKRVEIENCFRIMKTNLEGRPIFVQTKEHIKGHLFTVYLALLLISLLKKKYAEDITFDSLFDTLRNSTVDEIQNGIYKTVYRDKNLSMLCQRMDLNELSYEYINNITVRKLISKSKNR